MQSLQAEKRDIFGKKLAFARKAGKLPVVVYGPKDPAVSCFVNESDFRKVWKEAGESSIVSVEIAGAGKKDVLIHEVDVHPVSGVPLHVDFYAIEAGKKIEVAVPLVFEGVAPAIKTFGATIIKVMHEIEIAALPADLPHEIVADLSLLSELESKLLAKDIKLPKGVELRTGGDEVVAAVAEQREEEVVAAPVDLSAIEVEKKGKKEEEGALADGKGEAPKK